MRPPATTPVTACESVATDGDRPVVLTRETPTPPQTEARPGRGLAVDKEAGFTEIDSSVAAGCALSVKHEEAAAIAAFEAADAVAPPIKRRVAKP